MKILQRFSSLLAAEEACLPQYDEVQKRKLVDPLIMNVRTLVPISVTEHILMELSIFLKLAFLSALNSEQCRCWFQTVNQDLGCGKLLSTSYHFHQIFGRMEEAHFIDQTIH